MSIFNRKKKRKILKDLDDEEIREMGAERGTSYFKSRKITALIELIRSKKFILTTKYNDPGGKTFTLKQITSMDPVGIQRAAQQLTTLTNQLAQRDELLEYDNNILNNID